MKRYRMGYKVVMQDSDTANIDIYGEISSYQWWGDEVTAISFKKELKKAENAKKLNIYINTPGGDVFEAMAIRNEIMNHGASEKNVYVTGMCASAGTLLMCLKDTNINMYDGSMMMIHYPSTFAYGNIDDIGKTEKALQEITDNIIQLYAEKTGLNEEELKTYMQEESYFNAEKAVEIGFADKIIKEKSVNAQMSIQTIQMCGYKNVPKELIEEKKERVKMDLNELREKEPNLYAEVIEMGRTEERERIKALDEVYAPNDAQMVFEAKYGENKLSAEKLCVELNKRARVEAQAAEAQTTAQAKDYLEARKQATADMKNIEQGEDGKEDKDEKERQEAIARMAKRANEMGGRE